MSHKAMGIFIHDFLVKNNVSQYQEEDADEKDSPMKGQAAK